MSASLKGCEGWEFTERYAESRTEEERGKERREGMEGEGGDEGI